LVGGVDIDPDKAALDLGDVIGLETALGIPVFARLSDALARIGPTETPVMAAVHTTVSRFAGFAEQIGELMSAGLSVVSTSEELSFPWLSHPEEARSLHRAAVAADCTVLGTGVNPGFLMDTLPLALSGIAQSVDHVLVRRVIDASKRRGPFQVKIGAGLTEEEFRDRMATASMGHVGLPESVHMLSDTLGRELTGYEETVEPVISDKQMRTPHVSVEAGQVRGLEQTGRGMTADGEFARLTFRAALNEADECDTIELDGTPKLAARLTGTNGDIATAAIAVNAIRRVVDAPPGLITMRDLPLVTAR
jgi:4-hydroxy-tetrahydrodipicolinate reductase